MENLIKVKWFLYSGLLRVLDLLILCSELLLLLFRFQPLLLSKCDGFALLGTGLLSTNGSYLVLVDVSLIRGVYLEDRW